MDDTDTRASLLRSLMRGVFESFFFNLIPVFYF